MAALEEVGDFSLAVAVAPDMSAVRAFPPRSTIAGADNGPPPNTSDPNYIAGVGAPIGFGAEGNGEVVFSYTPTVTSTPEPASILTAGLALLVFAGRELISAGAP